MITVCYKWVHDLWELRNSELHGKDDESRKQLDREKAIREIKALCRIRDQVLPKHQDVFMETAEDHIEKLKTTCHLKTWVNAFRPQLTSSSQLATKTAVDNVIDIREYYRLDNMEANVRRVKAKIKMRKTRKSKDQLERPPKQKAKRRKNTMMRGRLKGMQTTRKYFVTRNTQSAGSASSTGEGYG